MYCRAASFMGGGGGGPLFPLKCWLLPWFTWFITWMDDKPLRFFLLPNTVMQLCNVTIISFVLKVAAF